MARTSSSWLRRLLPLCAALLVAAPLGWMAWTSRVPATYDMASMGTPDFGGGPAHVHAWSHRGTPVASLTADPDRPADVTETFHVRRDGSRITVNGTSPGPVLRATVGDLVQVTLVNDGVPDGTTLHWHGIDVPDAMDGVAGVTQDAVPEGGRFVYRWVADRPGTYWYHSHQLSHDQVRRGLLGAVVIEPPAPEPGVTEHLAVLHRYAGIATSNGEKGRQLVEAASGEEVRIRVVNTDNALTAVWVRGAPWRVAAIDGTDLSGPQPVTDRRIGVTAGGRVDLRLTVPATGASVELGAGRALVLGREPGGAQRQPTGDVDLLTYGTPAPTPLATATPDRTFRYAIGRRPGFLRARPGWWWTVNGRRFPDTPMFMVAPGDVVHMRISNNSGRSHPMHLHGHRLLVLSRDGHPARGSPWWTDSLEVADGASYEVAFLADNPGIWMDHCHNLPHAAQGLVSHLMYLGVRSSYRISARNEPE